MLGTGTGGDAQGDVIANIQNLNGSDFDDTLVGDWSNNELDGGDGNDTLSGMGGDDLLKGQGGNNTLDGGEGNDTLVSYGGATAFLGGNGIDTADLSHIGDAAGINLLTGVMSGGAAGDTFSGIEYLVGTYQNDTITGGADTNLNGADGDDVLVGGAGDNIVEGGWGNDTLYGGQGNDQLIGDENDDTFVFQAHSGLDEIVQFDGAGADGGDMLRFTPDTGYTTLAQIQAVTTYDIADGIATIHLSPGNVITVHNIYAPFVAGDVMFG